MSQNATLSTHDPLPARMQDLATDERGYPVPWFVAWRDGQPEFRAMDPEKFRRAVTERRCWVCGGRLGVNLCFVAGPMCGINRTSSEPPSHVDCGRWSARNCPFLAKPEMVRRPLESLEGVTPAAGMAIGRNPGVVMLWITREYEIFRADNGPLIQMGTPTSVEWWRESRPATRAEVLHSIDEGLPNLEAIARQEAGGLAALAAARQRFEHWLPK